MLYVRVRNLDTNTTFEFRMPDQAAVDKHILLNENNFGTAGSRVVFQEDITEQWKAERIAEEWGRADAWGKAGLDENSRASLLWLSADPACPAWRRERIAEVQAWWSALWSHYAQVRGRLAAGVDASFDVQVVGPCPWTIWQIAAVAP